MIDIRNTVQRLAGWSRLSTALTVNPDAYRPPILREPLSAREFEQTNRPSYIPGAGAAAELAMLARDTSRLELLDAGTAIVQLKVDGIRALWLHGLIRTREGGKLDAALHCAPALARLEHGFGEPMVFDGEYVEDDGFEATLAAHRRGRGNGVLWLFDAVPLSRWMEGRDDTPLETRLNRLRLNLQWADSPFVGMLDPWSLDGRQTIAKAEELWREGYEGVVIKRSGSPYVRARSADWLKLKETITATGRVVDMAMADGTLKVLFVRTAEGPIRIGTGWDRATAARLIEAWNGIQGLGQEQLLVEIAYQRSTGAKRSIRGARFVRIAGDVS